MEENSKVIFYCGVAVATKPMEDWDGSIGHWHLLKEHVHWEDAK